MLEAISPIDGRYNSRTKVLSKYFSEYGLIKYRVIVEVKYFLALLPLELKPLVGFPDNKHQEVANIIEDFTVDDALEIKRIESTTNHDVKAVEYFLRSKFKTLGLEQYGEMIHFGLTSQDVNNTAIPLSLMEASEEVLFPSLSDLLEKLTLRSRSWSDIPLLAHTHGQPASPTTLGKEFFVFADRLQAQIEKIKSIVFYAKFGGAVGNLNAHVVTFPAHDWINFSNNFMESLKLKRLPYTTQIDHYDHMSEYFQNLIRINTILIDLCRDIWTYISMNYFTQKVKSGEVGSSTMPHKVNPIDFENAEGNLGISNALLSHLSLKLPVSRLQRDLTDSTVLRNIGVPLAHTMIALKSLDKGLGKLEVNQPKIAQDLEANWAVVAEAYQSILRREGVEAPYELLKSFTRGKHTLDKLHMQNFIDTLSVDDEIKDELRRITPENYTGITDFPR
ncbi:MAG: adenylosuccinate lyase [Saprospiraceae bacterium]|nr:adenylosuccinate lyase [Saprospiraceae bacterium]